MIFLTDVNGTNEPDLVITMKMTRNMLLAGSDWTQMSDSPLSEADKQAWATYRQQLRDFPATWTPSETADFPDPPT